MAHSKVTITVEDRVLDLLRTRAERDGLKLSTAVARYAYSWAMLETSRELAAADERVGLHRAEHAEAQFALDVEADALEATRGNAA